MPIGRWVIEQACRQAAVWQRLNPDAAPVSVAVNLSARQLADPDLLQHIERAIRANAIDPATLWLELTESTLIDDTVYVERTLESLRGPRSAPRPGRLRRRLLVARLPETPAALDAEARPLLRREHHRERRGGAIVHAVSEMAETIGIGVVAEGVETRSRSARARAGCGFAQGFHFTEPVPAAEVEALLASPTTTFH